MLEEQTLGMESWLTEIYDYESPRRGEMRKGTILAIEDQGIFIDVGFKADGFVPRKDVDRLAGDYAASLTPGQEVMARVVRPQDREDELILSIYQAQQEEDWVKAEALLESGEIWNGEVKGHNQGGLIVEMGRLRGFIPASLVQAFPRRRLPSDERETKLASMVGQTLPLKVIEVERRRRRLVLSERAAQGELGDKILEELEAGQVRQGTVSRLVDFGAFVDLGGVDGLIHISELAWRRTNHPSEVIEVGDEIRVYVLRVDREDKKISLSLKRLEPDPWDRVYEVYAVGQQVPGTVTNVTSFGAFVALDLGIEGLAHISELGDPEPEQVSDVVRRGGHYMFEILRIDAERERIGLSLMPAEDQAQPETVPEAEAELEAEEESAGGEPVEPAGPDAAAGEPEAAAGEPEAAGGEPEAAAGEPETAAGEPEAAAGEPEAAAGEPETAGGEPEAAGAEQTPGKGGEGFWLSLMEHDEVRNDS